MIFYTPTSLQVGANCFLSLQPLTFDPEVSEHCWFPRIISNQAIQLHDWQLFGRDTGGNAICTMGMWVMWIHSFGQLTLTTMCQVFSCLRIHALSRGNVMLATVVVILSVTPIWADLLVFLLASLWINHKNLRHSRHSFIGHQLNKTLWMAVSALNLFHQILNSCMYHPVYFGLCTVITHPVVVRHVNDALTVLVNSIFVSQ